MSDLAARVAGLSPAQRKLLEQRLKGSRRHRRGRADRDHRHGLPISRAPESGCLLAVDPRGPQCRSARCRPIVGTPTRSYDPTGETPGKMSVRWAALHRQSRPVRSAVLRHHAARGGADGSAAAAALGSGLGSDGERRPAGRGTGRHADRRVRRHRRHGLLESLHAATTITTSRSTPTWAPATRCRSPRTALSYVFDFHGPSAAVDTACSSSSLAIHFAVESLRRGESDAALAGGVNMILTPETTIAFSKARMLSPEGVCRPFDARANGYVRGEGCGTACCSSGWRMPSATATTFWPCCGPRASTRTAAPRASVRRTANRKWPAFRRRSKQAGLTPDDIDYIEAHGTGTPLGDPIEMKALGANFRRAIRAARPVT